MKFENYLNEKFFNAFNMHGQTHEIFVNPNKREMKEVFKLADRYKSVGFICDLIDDKIYFFVRDNIIHQQAFDHIKPGKKLYKDSRWLTGEFQVQGNNVDDVNFGSMEYFSDPQVIKEVLDSDWSYFNKWIPDIDGEIQHFFSSWKRMNKKFLAANT